MENRVSAHPGRMTITPVSGQENTYDMVRADQPIVEGTPLNKATLFDEENETLYGLSGNEATVNNALKRVPQFSRITEAHPVAEGYSVSAGDVVDVNESGEIYAPLEWKFEGIPLSRSYTRILALSDHLFIGQSGSNLTMYAITIDGTETTINSPITGGFLAFARISDTEFLVAARNSSYGYTVQFLRYVYADGEWKIYQGATEPFPSMLYSDYVDCITIIGKWAIFSGRSLPEDATFPRKTYIGYCDISNLVPGKPIATLLSTHSGSDGNVNTTAVFKIDETHVVYFRFGHYTNGSSFTNAAQVYTFDQSQTFIATGTPYTEKMISGSTPVTAIHGARRFDGGIEIVSNYSTSSYSVYSTTYMIDPSYTVTKGTSVGIVPKSASSGTNWMSMSNSGDILVTAWGQGWWIKRAGETAYSKHTSFTNLTSYYPGVISPSSKTIFLPSNDRAEIQQLKTNASYAIALTDATAGQSVEIALEGQFDLTEITKGQEIWDANGYRIGYGYADGKLRVCSEAMNPLVSISGSYTGDNTYGSSNLTTLILPFKPRIVLIIGIPDNTTGACYFSYLTESGGFSQFQQTATRLTIAQFDKTVSWYCGAAAAQMNSSSFQYYFIAFR